MTRETAITDAYMFATSKAVAIGSIPTAKRNLLTNLAIKFYQDWQTEPSAGEWDSLYRVIGAGTVSATDQFELDTAINFISTDEQRENNKVRVLTTDGNYIYYTSVRPSELHQNRFRNAVAHVVDEGTHYVQFSRDFTSSDQAFGGTIEVPAIIKLDDLNSDTSEVLIDNANWLPWRMAAQYAYSYKSLRDMYPDLLDQANELMSGMISRNSSGNETTSTGVDYFATMGNVGIDC